MQLNELETPALLVDRVKLDRNLQRMHSHVHQCGSALRPHVKTAKSIDVIRRALAGEPGGITVSTLKEAEYFFGHGLTDIVYAVGIAPSKFRHVFDLIRRGARLGVILDNPQTAAALSAAAREADVRISVLIEIDVDGHRSGVHPDSELLLEVARALTEPTSLRGVLTHAGGSYDLRSTTEIAQMAERERAGTVSAAKRLRDAGFATPVVSVGSTPTATFSRDLTGVTEVRVGVYMFQDLVMAGLGVCQIDDIALSVLASVIGHQLQRNWLITDGGWTALSRDRGTSAQAVDHGYGLVCDAAGRVYGDLIVVSTSQEHGIVARRDGRPIDFSRFPVGTLLRVLPNHACATAAQHERYHLVEGESAAIVDCWDRFGGW